ncbi:mandelate racemase/muconate lactonizing enzyme family protein [Marinobacterium jannaschii]|uniref:mandelate racemase/muconate lactonizing enzyme family protein n=1 Tax=Marinobacterium jannaschii TaxID=64970 RepID=UPI000481963B|nr:mandelate racemase/muconate lactonizing enzyme family protein [Marinobacterium jannaschii]
MKISAIEVYHRALPISGEPYRMALQTLTALDSTLVRVRTDSGLEGWGESCPLGPSYQPEHMLGGRAALADMAPHLIGRNPLHIQQVNHVMNQALCGSLYAKAAIDMALWDIAGKAYGARVCDLLGGAVREQLPSYYAISLLPPDAAAAVAQQKQAEGFKRLQLKVGGRDISEDIAAVRKVAEVLAPDTALAVDANRGLSARDAIQLSLACREQRFVLEQPCMTYEQCLGVRRQISHPLYLDEVITDLNMLLRAIGDNAADGFGMKQSRVGGLSQMRTIRDVCAAAGLPMTSDDTWGGDLIAASCLHLGATLQPALCDGVWIAAPYIDGHYDEENAIDIVAGQLRLPSGHGLGVVPQLAAGEAPLMQFD